MEDMVEMEPSFAKASSTNKTPLQPRGCELSTAGSARTFLLLF